MENLTQQIESINCIESAIRRYIAGKHQEQRKITESDIVSFVLDLRRFCKSKFIDYDMCELEARLIIKYEKERIML